MMSFFWTYFSLVFATAVWGSTFFIIKTSLDVFSPFEILTFRFLLSALFVAIFLLISRKNVFEGLKKWLLLWGAFSLVYITQTIGLQYTDVSNSGFITGMFLVFIPIFAWIFFRRKVTKIEAISLGTILLWLLIFTWGLQHINIWDILTLWTACFVWLHIVLWEKLVTSWKNPLILNFQQFLVTWVLCSFFAQIWSGSYLHITSFYWFWILYLALWSIIAYGILLYAQKKIPSTHTGLILSLEPVFAYVFAVWFGGEGIENQKIFWWFLIVFALSIPYLYQEFLKRKKL